MSRLSDAIAENYRTGGSIKPQYNNKFTRSRQHLYEEIKNRTGENADSELDYSLGIIKDNIPEIQRYVLSQGEIPAKNITALTKQAYKLRCHQIEATSQAAGIPFADAQVLLESDEADEEEISSPQSDNFLGELFAPIGVASLQLERGEMHPDNFRDAPESLTGDVSSILGGALGIAGTKISSADFRRAAQNKPAGILGALGTGGTAHYNALRSWFQQYPKIAQMVISGQIADENALAMFVQQQNAVSQGGAKISPPPVTPVGATSINSNDIVGNVADYQRKQQLKKMLPVIIIGVVALVIIVVLITRKGASKS